MPDAQIIAARQARHQRRRAAAEQVVPKGCYCYTGLGYEPAAEAGAPGAFRIQTCPFWKRRRDWPQQASGYCRLLKLGDNSPGRDANGRRRATDLLWDQCKACDINWDDEFEATPADPA